jgi:hypothetical protein
VAVKKKPGPWVESKKNKNAAAGRATAESHRKLQRQAEARRKETPEAKGEGAVQAGSRRYPEPPLPKQHL